MTALLRHTPLAVSVLAATSHASADYTVTNLLTTPIRQPWRSSSTAAQQIDIDLGAIRVAPIIALQHANTATCTVTYGSAAYTTTNAGVQTLALDRHGIRKFSLALVGNVRYIRITFGGAVPDDSAAFYEAGALYVFAATFVLPEDPLLGGDAAANYPQTRIELANGNDVLLDRGAPKQRLNLRFRSLRTVDMDELTRRARGGVCWLDLVIAANRELQWPVRHAEDSSTRQFARANQDETQIPLREVS